MRKDFTNYCGFNIGDTVNYHAFQNSPATSTGHTIKRIEREPNNFGCDVAWITGKSGCISLNCLSLTSKKRVVLCDTRSRVGSSLMFWAARGGYTSDLSKAEVFSEQEATKLHKSCKTAVPMLLDLLLEKAVYAVDMQDIRVGKGDAQGGDYVAVVEGSYDGNNVMFISGEGGTFNYKEAAILSINDDKNRSLGKVYNLHKVSHMDAIARPTSQLLDSQLNDVTLFSIDNLSTREG